ncbi:MULTISPECIES: malate synthase G [Moraxella]|mgnify:FL=1|uniref:malate synthase G n=1 Tax=Moraxella TaxID=475 RepID=UPI000803A65B|nr:MULTISPECIES: malate synthase G [Moraxella]MBE9578943.1 malate synthase G [Moraxella sp. K1664]MBE9588288.1 malate synthase G [Moraxella sp. K1630]MBE9589763.1 malate synthase G [Moraxella sp. K127]MBE9596405.1 malate synthase G [Moraxella sp. K2450]MDH9218793.1 malate synthase G [Moraxella lacunata]
MATQRITKGSLAIDKILFDFIENEALPVAKLDSDTYWKNFEQVVLDLTPKNKALLARRDELQAKIDDWHKNNAYELSSYKNFLTEIGYLEPEVADFEISTQNVDDEIATIAGAQLVVPVRNARYALNAGNARWGSLYDALYGFDVIPETDGAEKGKGYNPVRGAKVVAFAKNFLDETFPLADGSHADVTSYTIKDGKLSAKIDDKVTTLTENKVVGYNGTPDNPREIILKNNGLHVIIQIDPESPIGKDDKAGVKDVVLESAVTTIQDLEDSVAAVDAEEKVEGYRNWLGLMKGNLSETLEKNGKTITRTLNADRTYTDLNGNAKTLHGRSVMLLRNVGHLMTNPAILVGGEEIFEGIMDALITPMLSAVDIRGENTLRNSRTGSMYIVKPKMHGSDEVAFAVELFSRAEEAIGLPKNSLKMGIMDEERRTSANLKNCIAQARERTIFINTGFMDRTGDEIHTAMHAGAFVRKGEIKGQAWFGAYEERNVSIGLKAGLRGKAQIGKGMWPKPDELADMYRTKIEHPQAGANCAWVPSPSGAVIHAIHYHKCNVMNRQEELARLATPSLDDLLTIPLATDTNWTADEKRRELENNCQGILGYVVRWVDLGVGCSKVPDINNVGLMEDRATLRISSQHVANWLAHGVVTADEVWDTLKRMAKVVDEQNASDPAYRPMSADFDNNIAFHAAADLIFKGATEPSGYTEPLLHKARLKLKGYQGD